MRFERIDEKTVKCYISREELEEFDITYKDFITRSDKAIEVMTRIMMQAEEEVGYQPGGLMFELQIMMLPDQSMILVFSEKDPENLIPGGKEIKDWLNMIKDALSLKAKDVEKALSLAGGSKGIGEASKEQMEEEAGNEKQASPGIAVFAFEKLRDVCTYAGNLPGNLRIKSELYELDGEYFLYLEKGSASYERYSKACVLAMEYARLHTAKESRLEYLREHATCLIPDHAVQKMKF